MIVFETQEAFEEAVMRVLRERIVVGVTVSKVNDGWYGENTQTKVEVSLFDKKDGIDIDRGSDYA